MEPPLRPRAVSGEAKVPGATAPALGQQWKMGLGQGLGARHLPKERRNREAQTGWMQKNLKMKLNDRNW